jgi:hypothetical protein
MYLGNVEIDTNSGKGEENQPYEQKLHIIAGDCRKYLEKYPPGTETRSESIRKMMERPRHRRILELGRHT